MFFKKNRGRDCKMKNKFFSAFGILLVFGLVFAGCKMDEEAPSVDVTGTWEGIKVVDPDAPDVYRNNAFNSNSKWEFDLGGKGNYVLSTRGEAYKCKGTYVFTENEFMRTITHKWDLELGDSDWVEFEAKEESGDEGEGEEKKPKPRYGYIFHDSETLEITALIEDFKIDEIVGVYKRKPAE